MTSQDGRTYLACLITNQLQIVIEGSKLPSSLNPAFFLTTFRSDRYVVYRVTWIVTRCQIIIIMCSKLAQRTRLEMRVFMVEWWEQLHCTTYSHSVCEGGRERERAIYRPRLSTKGCNRRFSLVVVKFVHSQPSLDSSTHFLCLIQCNNQTTECDITLFVW